MSLVLAFPGTACVLAAAALDRWDMARMWPALAFLGAAWAWAGYQAWLRRGKARRP